MAAHIVFALCPLGPEARSTGRGGAEHIGAREHVTNRPAPALRETLYPPPRPSIAGSERSAAGLR